MAISVSTNDMANPKRGGAADDASQSPRSRVRRLVLGIVAKKSPGQPVSDDATLAEIGVTSVDMVTLLLSVESEFDVEVPPHEITADVFRSIATIDSLVRRLLPDILTV
jgi:acyl carrier protein